MEVTANVFINVAALLRPERKIGREQIGKIRRFFVVDGRREKEWETLQWQQ